MILISKKELMKYAAEDYIPVAALNKLTEFDIDIEINYKKLDEWDESLIKLNANIDDADD